MDSKIKDLQDQIKEAIKSRQFEKSKELNKLIEIERDLDYQQLLHQNRQELVEFIRASIKNYRETIMMIKDFTSRRGEPILFSINDSLVQMRESHIKRLTDFEIEKKIDLVKKQSMKSAEEILLDKAAVSLAKSKQYDEAQVLYKKMKQIEEERLNRCLTENNRVFTEKEKRLFEHFGQEISILEEKCRKNLSLVDDSINDDIVVETKKLNISIKNFLQQRVLVTNSGVVLKEQQHRTVRELTNAAKQVLFEENMENIIDLRK